MILCTAAAEPLLTMQLVNEHLPGQVLLHSTADTVCTSVLAELEANAALLCQLETAGGGDFVQARIVFPGIEPGHSLFSNLCQHRRHVRQLTTKHTCGRACAADRLCKDMLYGS